MRFARVLIVVVLIVSLFGNFVMYMKWSGKRPIFTVNGQPVSKRDFQNYVEMRAGPQAKVDMVQELLVRQAAQKEGVTPSDKEINDLIDEQKEKDWQFAQQLATKPGALMDANRMIFMGLAKQRLLTKGITVTPEQIQEEYKSHPFAYDAPNKARVELAVILDGSRTNDVKELLQKPVNPTVIMQQLSRKAVVFLGDQNKLTITQPFGTQQNAAIFKMKPNDVIVLPPDPGLARQGAKAMVIRMIEITPGHKADLNDPKTKEKITTQVALRSAKPWQEYLSKLWADANFQSEDPSDKKMIERAWFPDRASADAK